MTDTQAATALELFIENDADLHHQQQVPIFKDLMTKKARDEYSHDLAVKLFGYLVEAGAKKYAQQFGSPGQPWHKMFDPPTRRAVAEELTKAFETEARLGAYDDLLPKKYQVQKKAPHGVGGRAAASRRHHATIHHEAEGASPRAGGSVGGYYGYTHKKSPAELDREIAHALMRRRGR